MNASVPIDPRDDRRAGLRFPLQAWPAIGAGLLWLSHGFDAGPLGFVLALLPGGLLMGTGVTTLLMPGDERLHHFMAFGGLLGAVFGLGALFAAGPVAGLSLIGLSALAWVCAGRLSVAQTTLPEGLPPFEESWRQAAEVAGDDTILAFMSASMVVPDGDERRAVVHEVREALALFEERGFLEKPAAYHLTPPVLNEVELQPRTTAGVTYQHLRFPSEYEPASDEPGRDRWLSYAPNRTAHAWLLEHGTPGRPWIVCIHGYQMGVPRIDLQAFRAAELHHQLGLNVLLPVLPLHGPRKIGRLSGDGFLAGNMLDSIHGISQALWDMRRMIGWARGRGAEAIGVYGLSLGGYHTAALASVEEGLACAIPGIPATDVARLVWRHGPPGLLRSIEALGARQEMLRRVMTVASPLDLEPLVPHERRYLFAAQMDQLVPADQVADLWEHWQRPRIEWYPGGHLTFGLHANVRGLLREAFRESGLTS